MTGKLYLLKELELKSNSANAARNDAQGKKMFLIKMEMIYYILMLLQVLMP